MLISRSRFAAILGAGVIATVASGQTTASAPAFEVASVTIAPPWDFRPPSPFKFENTPVRVDIRYTTMAYLLQFAYDVDPTRQTGPDWIRTETYNVQATKPPNTSTEDTKLMMQTLLAERFKLVVHKEKKPVTGYAITVLEGGPKLTGVQPPQSGQSLGGGRGSLAAVRIQGTLTMKQIAMHLQREIRRPVADATGLTGYFDVDLQFASDDPARVSDVPLPTLSAALKAVGLKLETRPAEIETLVVDRGDKTPIQN